MRKPIFILLLGLLFGGIVSAQSITEFTAKEIALPSPNGDTIRLSSLRGKIVLLDFWASWCLPCRVANKKLSKMYPKYKDKGFEIFSVSLDDNYDDWKKAIQKDKISWMQVIDPRGWEAQTAIDWNIYALPTSYVINSDGKLLAMDLEGKDLEKLLKELLDK
jgi:thiol-disulfide isomerase/thioredoxin